MRGRGFARGVVRDRRPRWPQAPSRAGAASSPREQPNGLVATALRFGSRPKKARRPTPQGADGREPVHKNQAGGSVQPRRPEVHWGANTAGNAGMFARLANNALVRSSFPRRGPHALLGWNDM